MEHRPTKEYANASSAYLRLSGELAKGRASIRALDAAHITRFVGSNGPEGLECSVVARHSTVGGLEPQLCSNDARRRMT